MFLEPSQSFSAVTALEISARAPDLPEETVQLLLQDNEQENNLLNEALQAGLETYCRECMRLAEKPEPNHEGDDVGGEAVMVE